MASLAKFERLRSQLSNARQEIKAGARIGTTSLLTNGGAIIAGWINAKMPVIPNTEFPTNGLLGSGLVVASMAGLFDEYSDHAAAVGNGLLAPLIAKESEAYFSSDD
jgi:hypothetical protein